MENEMTTQDMWDFLEKGAHVAHIGTTRADGRPHVTPVSFGAWDGKVYAVLVGGSIKVKNLRRDPRVYISVATDERPYQFVLVEGKPRLPRTAWSRCWRGSFPGTSARNEDAPSLRNRWSDYHICW